MTARPEHQRAAGNGRLRASHSDREHVVGVLQEAFVQGRLDRDELGERVSLALCARTYADLAAIIDDIPRSVARRRPASAPPPVPDQTVAKPPTSVAGWLLGGLIPASLLGATALGPLDAVGGALWLLALVAVMVWVLGGLLILRARVSEHLAAEQARLARRRAEGQDPRRSWPS